MIVPRKMNPPCREAALCSFRLRINLFTRLDSLSRLILVGWVCLGTWGCGTAEKSQPAVMGPPADWKMIYALDFGDYQFQYGQENGAQLREDFSYYLYHRGGLVEGQPSGPIVQVIDVKHQGFGNRVETPEVRDITGDGVPELIVESFSGGAHCCWTYRIYSLGETLTCIGYFPDTAHGLLFADYDQDGVYEIDTTDATFDYWQTAYAYSPKPLIIFRYGPDGYHLDTERMHTPPPEDDHFQAEVVKVSSEMGKHELTGLQDDPWKQTGVPPSLWSFMLDLIYTGNGSMAWDFYNQVWQDGVTGKAEFLALDHGDVRQG